MTRKTTDLIFTGIFSMLIASTAVENITNGYTILLSQHISIGCAVLLIIMHFARARYTRHALGIVLLFALFNLIYLGIGISVYSVHLPILPPLNLIALILIAVYVFVYKAGIKRVFGNFFKGTPEEQQDAYLKDLNFYQRKFESYTSEELEVMYRDLKDYPPAAQETLKKLRGEI